MAEKRIDPAFDARNSVPADLAVLRNLLLGYSEHLASLAVKARAFGNKSDALDAFFLDSLDATLSSSDASVAKLALATLKANCLAQLAEYLGAPCEPDYLREVEARTLETIENIAKPDAETLAQILAEGETFSPENLLATYGETIYGLRETISAGLKGAASSLRLVLKMKPARERREFEAQGLNARIKTLRPRKDKELIDELKAQLETIETEVAFWKEKENSLIEGIVDVLAFLDPTPRDGETQGENGIAKERNEPDALFETLRKTGELAVDAFRIFELATFLTYGSPVPTSVVPSPLPGVCAVFSGDDFDSLLEVLERAEFSDVNIWTRGEAIAAHSFPAFRKYRRLVGHYGNGRSEQNKDLGAFPGSIIVSSRPFDEPSDDFADYVFSVRDFPWDDVRTIERSDKGSLNLDLPIRGALDSGGYPKKRPTTKRPLGFGGEQMASLVEKSARGYRLGALKRVLAIGGVDAPDSALKSGADDSKATYYERLWDAASENCVALTFGDLQFRFVKTTAAPTSFGTPRAIDLGRARDMNATLRFAEALEKELDKTPETSPVAFFIGLWDERSVACLLAPIALGYRDIFVGPYRPEIWNDEIVALLNEKASVKLIDSPEQDAASLGAV